jgi:virginiamycin B lyase
MSARRHRPLLGAPVALLLLAPALPARAILEFPLATSHLPNQITVGPDGALWFTQVDRIGRITTGGVATDFVIGSVSNPQGIVTGPDGALWFTESSSVGRVTTAGGLTHAPAPGGPQDIAVSGSRSRATRSAA